MKSKRYLYISLAINILLAIICIFLLYLYINTVFKELPLVFSDMQKSNIREYKRIIVELESKDERRIKELLDSLKNLVELNEELGDNRSFDKLIELYQKKEYPKRSYYFERIIMYLSSRKKNEFTKQYVLKILGKPDTVIMSQKPEEYTEEFQYFYNTRGTAWGAFVFIKNSKVLLVAFNQIDSLKTPSAKTDEEKK